MGWFGRKKEIRLEVVDVSCGDFHQEVVGESFYQDNIRRIAKREGDEFMACLLPDRKNRHDRNAIMVLHAELGQVGHLPRELAAVVAAGMWKLQSAKQVATCQARLAGGYRGKSYGVWLDCDLSQFGADVTAGSKRT